MVDPPRLGPRAIAPATVGVGIVYPQGRAPSAAVGTEVDYYTLVPEKSYHVPKPWVKLVSSSILIPCWESSLHGMRYGIGLGKLLSSRGWIVNVHVRQKSHEIESARSTPVGEDIATAVTSKPEIKIR